MNQKQKDYILSHWKGYDMVDSEDEMKKVLNILEAHSETLDGLYDVVIGNTDMFCGIWMNSNPETAREVKDILYQFNIFYNNKEEMQEAVKEDAEDCGMTIEEFLSTEDVRETSDGLVRILYY